MARGRGQGGRRAWPSRWGDPGIRDRRLGGVHQAEGKRQNKETWVSKKEGFAQDKDFCPVLGLCSDTNFAEVLLNGEVSLFSLTFIGLPRCCTSKESCQGQKMQERQARFLAQFQKIPCSWKRRPALVFLPGKSHGQRSPAGYNLWGCKRVEPNLATKQQQLPSQRVYNKQG